MASIARKFLIWIGIGLASSIAALAVCSQSVRSSLVGQLIWRMELAAYDFQASYSVSGTSSDDIVIVGIDQESIGELGVWPWSREYHAEVLEKLAEAGAKVVGLDILLHTVSNPEVTSEAAEDKPLDWEPPPGKADVKLEAALKKCGNVVLAVASSKKRVGSGEVGASVQQMLFPYPGFEDAALDIGNVDMTTDADGSIRRCGISQLYQDERLFSMALVLAAHYLDTSPPDLARTVADAAGSTDSHPIAGNFLVAYRGSPGLGFIRKPYYQVLRGGVTADLRQLVQGKIVLVGATTRSLGDVHDTPVSGGAGSLDEAQQMPGVEIIASAVDTILTGGFRKQASDSLVSALVILLCIGIAVIGTKLRPLLALFAGWLPGEAAVVLVVFWFWEHESTWLPIVPLSLGVTLSYVITVVYREFTTERLRRSMQQAWSRRVSSEVLQVILNTPSLAKVKGRRLNATVLFTDLEGFTPFSHENPPEQVVSSLNEYLSMITTVVRDHGGTVHKFIGDGVFAAFGDPVPHWDHGRRAVQAACAIQHGAAKLAASRPQGERWNPRVRIGIHTGPVVAGDIGSPELLEYTLIGDTVSTASRLEAVNKQFGTGIIISKATEEIIGSGFNVRPLGPTPIRGLTEPIELFAIEPGSPEDQG